MWKQKRVYQKPRYLPPNFTVSLDLISIIKSNLKSSQAFRCEGVTNTFSPGLRASTPVLAINLKCDSIHERGIQTRLSKVKCFTSDHTKAAQKSEIQTEVCPIAQPTLPEHCRQRRGCPTVRKKHFLSSEEATENFYLRKKKKHLLLLCGCRWVESI